MINNCILDNSDLDQKLAELENLPNIDMDELEKLELQQKELEETDAGMKIMARKFRTTLQNKVRLKVLPEQLTLFVNTSVTLKKCIIQ